MNAVIGIDFGTLSARALVVDARDGTELGTAVSEYRHGVMDRVLAATGAELPPQWALQDPADYLEALRTVVLAAVREAGVAAEQVVGIATAFTASTPLPVLADGTPLCDLFPDRPHAYVKLWKHHAAQRHADRVNAVAEERGEPWLARYGGRISSEWQFAKALQVLDEDPELYAGMDRWIEAADWIIWQLCGRETRNVCTAGYKGIHQDGAYPAQDYLRELDERFGDFVATKLAHPLSPLGARAGGLTPQAADWTGLPAGIAVAVGNVDAHVTAPAARAVDPGQLLMIMGTSTCHVMNGEQLADVAGMCGVVRDGIVPGLYGYEAGQTGVGDIFGWFVEQAVPPRYHAAASARGLDVHAYL
jgi:L-ribulokinase